VLINQLNENTIFLNLDYYQDPIIEQVAERYNQAVQQVMYEQADVQTALDVAQAEAETIFANRSSP
jgi:ABC-type glycerol-3-phosphate transport system substrate-binding protein